MYTDNGCPEIDRQAGWNLIRETEEYQTQHASLRALRSRSVEPSDQWDLQAVLIGRSYKALPIDSSLATKWLADKFPSAPAEIIARAPVPSTYDASKVPSPSTSAGFEAGRAISRG